MALSSMTGFARADGVAGPYAWAWELKSVNAKGLELRLRVPPGWDAVEAPLRARAAEALGARHDPRQTSVQRAGIAPVVRVNEPVLAAVLSTMRDVAASASMLRRRRIDGILGLKGVIEVIDEDEREEDRRAAEAAVIAGFCDGARKPYRDAPARGRSARRRIARRGSTRSRR